MGTYPTTPRSDFLAWCQAHGQLFVDHAVAIGLTPAQATAFKSSTTAAADTLTQHQIAQDAARASTVNVNDKFAGLREAAATMVRTIRTFAENTNNPNVYVIAQIPPPATPTPMAPPARPTNMSVALDPSTGEVTIGWKATNPAGSQGTAYIVRRRIGTTGAFSFVGVTGTKKFTDSTFFAGPDSVQYTIQGQRSDQSGPVSDILTVNFGRVGPGFAIESVENGEQEMQMAA